MVNNALAVHLRTLEAVAGGAIVYQRGVQSFELTGTLARKRPDVEEGQGKAAITAKLVDWLVKPFSGDVKTQLVEPRQGDIVVSADGRTFDVRATIAGSPCWEWSDPRHTFYRIHTVEQKQD
jgi:hypothetical protein